MNEKTNIYELVIKMAENIELLCKRIDKMEDRIINREHDLVDIYGRLSRLEMEVENDE